MQMKGLLALLGATVLSSAQIWAGTPSSVDMNTDAPPAIVETGDTVYVTNTDTGPATQTINDNMVVEHGGKIYLGWVGSDTAGGSSSIANAAIGLTVTGDVMIGGDTWVGKMPTGSGSMFAGAYPQFPDESTEDVTLTVGGNFTVGIDEGDGNHDGFMVFAGDGNSSKVLVTGDALVTGGHNHVYDNTWMSGTLATQALLQAKTFSMTGGSFEVIGTKASITTTNTDASVNAMTFGGDSEVMLMAGGILDASQGGNVVVDAGGTVAGYFFLGGTAGEVKLASGAKFLVADGGTLSLEQGAVTASGTGSSVEINGSLILGHSSGNPFAYVSDFTVLRGETITISDTAKIELSDAFITKALADHTLADATATVVEATTALDFDGWASGSRALVENFYGSFNFTKTPTSIIFNTVTATDFTNTQESLDAAKTQAAKVLGAGGADVRSLPKGYEKVIMGLAASTLSLADVGGVAGITSDRSDAGDLNASIWSGMVSGAGSSSGTYNAGLTSMLGNGRGSGVNAVAMGSAGEAQRSVEGRIASNNSTLAKVRDSVGSDQSLASFILNRDYMNRVWAGGFGLWEDADMRKGVSGYKYDSYGAMLGYDRVFGPVTAGVAFGYTSGDYEDKAAVAHDSDIDSYNVSLYATYNHCSGFFASVIGGYTYSDNDINEFDGTDWAREDFHTNTWNVGAKFGYDWRPADCWTITPSVGLFYTHAKNSAHTVNYGGVSLLTYGAMKNHATTIPVELAAGYDVITGSGSVLNLNARVGYTYNFNDDAIDGDVFLNGLNGVGALRASGRESGHHTFSAGAGVKYTHDRFDLGLRYDYFGKADYDAHHVMATIGLSF